MEVGPNEIVYSLPFSYSFLVKGCHNLRTDSRIRRLQGNNLIKIMVRYGIFKIKKRYAKNSEIPILSICYSFIRFKGTYILLLKKIFVRSHHMPAV